MKFDKSVKVNLGNYQSIGLGVSDAPSFEECDRVIVEELLRMDIAVDERVHRALGWLEKE